MRGGRQREVTQLKLDHLTNDETRGLWTEKEKQQWATAVDAYLSALPEPARARKIDLFNRSDPEVVAEIHRNGPPPSSVVAKVRGARIAKTAKRN